VISGYGKFFMGLLVGAMLVGGVAYSTTVNNTPEGGYLLCANNKTRVVTFPSKLSCPSGTKPIEVAGAFSASNDYAEESVEDSPTPATSKPTKNASARCNLDYLLQPNADVDAGVASCTPKELNNLIQQVSAVDDNPNLSVEQKKKDISVLTIFVNAISKKSK
jgi:hypothetical protein